MTEREAVGNVLMDITGVEGSLSQILWPKILDCFLANKVRAIHLYNNKNETWSISTLFLELATIIMVVCLIKWCYDQKTESFVGTKLLSFSSQQIFPSAVVSSAWADVAKRDSDMVLYNNQSHINCMDSQNSFPDSSAHSYKRGSQFQFMQGSDRSLTEASSICQPLLEHPTSAAGISSSGQKIFSSGLNEIVDSDRALSLLSSTPAVTREIGLSHMVQQPASIPRSQSHGLQYGGLSHFPFAQDFNSRPQDSHVSNSSSPLHFHDMLQNAQDGSSTSGGSQQTLAFMWD